MPRLPLPLVRRSTAERWSLPAWLGAALLIHGAAMFLGAPAPALVDAGRSQRVEARLLAAAPESTPAPTATAAPSAPTAPLRPASRAPAPAVTSAAVAGRSEAQPEPALNAAPAGSAVPAVAAGAPAAAVGAAPPLVSEGIEYLRAPAPAYPRAARALGEQGRVLLKVLVDESGAPHTIEILESSGYIRLDDAARAALARAWFKPYRHGGQVRPMWARVPISFQLDR